MSLLSKSLPIQRGNVRLNNLQVLNAILFCWSTSASGAGFQAIWRLAHLLRAHESLVKSSALDRVFEKLPATGADCAHQDRGL
jgi:hypothetical protein